MKLKNISRICTKTKRIEVKDVAQDNGEIVQWMGNGSAAYRLDNVPYLNKNAIFTLLDIDLKKQADYNFVQEEVTNHHDLYQDIWENEKLILPLGFSFLYHQKNRAIFAHSKTIYLLNAQHLSPLSDEVEFYVRTKGNDTHIVAKKGFFACAVLKTDIQTEDIFEIFKDITKSMESQLQCEEQSVKYHTSHSTELDNITIFDGITLKND